MSKAVNSGLILLDKKPGVTSFDALRDVKRALGTGKVGHTGTLDKFAEGLLLVLSGRALKLGQWFSNCDKQYIGTIQFGIETDTLDPEGEPIAQASPPSREAVEQVLSQFTGAIMQAPPAFSAIHINGKRASALARSGEAPVMEKRPVHIYRLELIGWDSPFARIFVHCSSGTYIRSLARDIALAAGSRAHLCALARTQIAGFNMEFFRNNTHAEPQRRGEFLLYDIDKTVIGALGLSWFEVSPEETEKIMHGKQLAPILGDKPLVSQPLSICASVPLREASSESFSAAIFSGAELIAIVEKTGGKWKYGHVFGA